MQIYCLVCKRNTENLDSKMLRTKNGRPFLSWKCAVWGIKKSTFVKEQGAKGLLSSLGIKIPLS